MDKKNTSNEKARTPALAPQLQVRSDLRSGSDLETCEFNLNKWRERYYYWYNVAKTAGKI